MLVFSRIQKRICIFNKISLFQWPEMTHSAFEKNFFFEIFKKFFSSNLAELCSEKVFFKNRKKKFFLKKNFCGHDFFFKISTKSRKIDKSNKCQRFQIGKTLRFSDHIDFFEFGLVQHRKLTKNPKKIFKKNFFFKCVICQLVWFDTN